MQSWNNYIQIWLRLQTATMDKHNTKIKEYNLYEYWLITKVVNKTTVNKSATYLAD